MYFTCACVRVYTYTECPIFNDDLKFLLNILEKNVSDKNFDFEGGIKWYYWFDLVWRS